MLPVEQAYLVSADRKIDLNYDTINISNINNNERKKIRTEENPSKTDQAKHERVNREL